MKEVLIDMHRLKHNPYNGLYTFSLELGKSLAAINDPEIKLHYYVPKDSFGRFGENVAYTQHHSIDKFFMSGTSKYDVWHITTSLSWYHPFNRRTKVVFTLHDLSFLIEEQDNFKRNKRLLKEMQRRIDRADYIVGISRFALDFAKEHINFRGKPTRVIYNGVRVKRFEHYDQPVYRPKNKFLFTIGLVQPRKNFHTLPALLKDNEYELIIAGLNNFSYADKIREEARLHGVEDRVKLIGAITEQDKYWYYQHCEAFLFPSIAEGFGIPIVEAMSFGKPVFLSTQTSLPEIGGSEAYYFENFAPDHMHEIFRKSLNDYQTTQPADKLKARAALFSYDKAATEYMEIYKSL